MKDAAPDKTDLEPAYVEEDHETGEKTLVVTNNADRPTKLKERTTDEVFL